MSIFSASSAFTLNAKSQGLFSSHTAFKKPTFNNNFNKSFNDNANLLTPVHPKDLVSKKQNFAKVSSKNQDAELLLCEPIKKIKFSKDGTHSYELLNNNKTQQNLVKTTRLTIEEVFNTPFEQKPRKGSLLEDCFDEGSSLSFISSHSSFDNLDDDLVSRKSSDCLIIGAERKNCKTDVQQSLVMKDNLIGCLSYLNQETMHFNNLESHSVFFDQPLSGYLMTIPDDITSTSGLARNGPLCIPPNSLSEYIQFTMQNTQQLGLNFSDKAINELVKEAKNREDGYDSDSYATRSTSIEQEKGSSPTYSSNEDIYAERKLEGNDLRAQKTERGRKQAQMRTNNKEKKGRSLNLKLDLNPKQIKVQRRLNRLQLLRYQQEDIEEEYESLKQFGISDLLSRGNSTIPESNDDVKEVELSENEFDVEYYIATIPQLGEVNPRRRISPALIWNPLNLEEGKLQEYLRQLEEILESPVSDIEAAMKLLNNHNMNISLALEAVKENIGLYSEVFRLKVKRLRRRGA